MTEQPAAVSSTAAGSDRLVMRRFMWWTTLSSFGGGLVLPLTALFLAERTSLGTGGAAAYFAIVAITELVTSSVLAVVRFTPSPGMLAGTGYLILGAGYALLATARELMAVLLIAFIVGVGRGTSAGGVPAWMRRVLGTNELRDVFARRYRALNFGLGIGLLAATVSLSILDTSIIPLLFVLNGLTFVPISLFLLRRRGSASDPGPSSPTVMRVRQLLRLAGPICIVDFCVFAFAYSQFDSALPLTAVRLQHSAVGFVSAVVAVNTVAVVVLQRPVSIVLERWLPGRGMQIAMGLWVTAFAVAAVTSLGPGFVSWGGLVALAVLFACAECAYASSFQPWLLATVPDAEATRVSSMANVCSSVGLALGPSFGVLLISSGQAAVVWAALAAGCLLSVALIAVVLYVTGRSWPAGALSR